MSALSVLSSPLRPCSMSPLTGFTRTGFCMASSQDPGKHLIAAVVNTPFLQYSKKRGNDLMTPHPPHFPGLKEGDRWCLCVDRWKEAFMDRKQYGDEIVPQVVLEATHIDALQSVTLDDLKAFALPSTDTEDSQPTDKSEL